MNIGFYVNDISTETSQYTTTRLALAATNRGHRAWFIGAEDLTYDSDETVKARGRSAPKSRYKNTEVFLRDVHGKNAIQERITVDDLDILMLRSDPSIETGIRAWAQGVGIIFGRIAMRHGVIVVNDPDGLARAMNKMYFQFFPEEARPRTIITRHREEIKQFAGDVGGTIVLKPLQGSGGQGVFLVRPRDRPNLNQMIDAVSRDGYIVAQEYLSAAEGGDTRLFLLNGAPLRHKGKYCAFRRVRQGDDMRSNIHAGGSKARAEITETDLKLAEMVRPKLVQDGMFLVGLDIVGDKLMEINVFSPGGIGSARLFEKVNFAYPIMEALERKVDYMRYYRRNFSNVDMAIL